VLVTGLEELLLGQSGGGIEEKWVVEFMQTDLTQCNGIVKS